MAGTWTCSEDEDFGSLGDNRVIVIGGTSGVPATFADFVTADAAGEAVLLAATACTASMSLSYQIRPTMEIALTISSIISGSTAGAGDTLDISGSDWDGQAQNESIDVSGGDGTYNGSYKWRTITNVNCVGWADGTLRVTQPQWGFVWDYGNSSQYQVDCNFDIGNASNSTYFKSVEQVYFLTNYWPSSTLNATLKLGEVTNGKSTDSSYWSLGANAGTYRNIVNNGTILIYGSTLRIRDATPWVNMQGANGSAIVQESIIIGGGNRFYFWVSLGSWSLLDTYFTGLGYFIFQSAPTLFSGVTLDHITNYIPFEENLTSVGLNITNPSTWAVMVSVGKTWYDRDPVWAVDLAKVYAQDVGRVYYQQYTCNIHMVDKDGNAIQLVTVLCEDKDDTQIFSVSTDASGDISEQNINYRNKENSINTTYSPHKFTLSKAGYETLVIDNVTVDAPIKWHLELQPLRARVYGRSHRIQTSQFI